MNATELKAAQKRISAEIDAHAKKMGYNEEDIMPIRDGVCDFYGYLNSNPKVMWILKEPNGQFANGELEGGGWSIVEESFKNDIEGVAKQPTWQPIIYVMSGYLNGQKYEDMSYIRDDMDMAKVLQKIAYLNVGKMPGYRTSPDYKIRQFYNQWKPILDRQIETYSPDVIIFGNTFECFREYFEQKGLENVGSAPEWIDIYKSDNRLLLAAWHPAARKSKKEYVNTLIEALNKYYPINK